MRNTLTMVVLAAAVSLQAVPAAAQDGYDRRANDDRRAYDARRGYDDHHRRNTYYNRRQDCRRSNGTTGTIAGAVGGGVIGNVLGGGTLGTLAGAGGGALLGRQLDKNHDRAQNRRNGC